MANMSYCRFENTYRDLLQCLSAMNDRLDDRETGYKERLVDVCREIIEEYELNKMSDDVWSDDDWVELERGDADMEAQDGDVFGENKI